MKTGGDVASDLFADREVGTRTTNNVNENMDSSKNMAKSNNTESMSNENSDGDTAESKMRPRQWSIRPNDWATT